MSDGSGRPIRRLAGRGRCTASRRWVVEVHVLAHVSMITYHVDVYRSRPIGASLLTTGLRLTSNNGSVHLDWAILVLCKVFVDFSNSLREYSTKLGIFSPTTVKWHIIHVNCVCPYTLPPHMILCEVSSDECAAAVVPALRFTLTVSSLFNSAATAINSQARTCQWSR